MQLFAHHMRIIYIYLFRSVVTRRAIYGGKTLIRIRVSQRGENHESTLSFRS